jgi:acetyltransferase-like isoleucine patch superfamily enzyme
LRIRASSAGRPRVHVYKGDRTRAVIGRLVSIGADVDIHVGGNHHIDWVTTYPLREMFGLPGAYVDNPWSRGDVVVGDDVRIGQGAKLMSGVRVGNGAVVAPFAVVANDVEPGVVVAGNPARASAPTSHADADSPPAAPAPSVGNARLRHVHAQASRGVASARRLIGRALHRLAFVIETADAAPLMPPTSVAARGGIVTCGRATYGEPVVHGAPGGAARLRIGSYSSIGPGCEVLLAWDGMRSAAVAPAQQSGQAAATDVTIGSDVWIGTGAKILPGVTIGDGAVVAAWSVVTTDVAPFAVVAGNPAEEKSRRFDGETMAALLRIRWWDWSENEVMSRWQELCNPAVAAFVERYDPDRSAPS